MSQNNGETHTQKAHKAKLSALLKKVEDMQSKTRNDLSLAAGRPHCDNVSRFCFNLALLNITRIRNDLVNIQNTGDELADFRANEVIHEEVKRTVEQLDNQTRKEIGFDHATFQADLEAKVKANMEDIFNEALMTEMKKQVQAQIKVALMEEMKSTQEKQTTTLKRKLDEMESNVKKERR